jgi:glycosyltransferase involved in cell wall biosynthesis
MKPTVTIGMCIRNCEDLVKEAVDSIVAQDFPHNFMELIFVDDGSTDKTLSAIKEYASKIDVPYKIFHTSWKGLGHARNLVVANSEGKYLLWVDGDMKLSKDYLTEQVSFMENHPKVGIAKGKQDMDSGGNLLATLETYSRAAGRLRDYSSEESRFKSLGTGGAIYRVEAIKQAGCFDEHITGYGEDFDAEYRVRNAGWVLTTIDVKFSDYEKHGLTWKELFNKYFKRGYDLNYFVHKNKNLINLPNMLPPMAFIGGLLQSSTVYRLKHKKISFLIPFQCAFKNTAWWIGFTRSTLHL